MNISGRSTDFKLGDELLEKGGLHVILTFIPNNSRVEEQNYGRAGRKGGSGTWQLIINYQDTMNKFFSNFLNKFELVYREYFNICQNENIINEIDDEFNGFSIEFIREAREKKELIRMENAKKYIEKVDIEDKLFNEYCKMIEERQELRKPEKKIYLDAIEERWAIFFYNLDIKDKTWEKVKIEFDKFKREIMNDYDNGTVIRNPGYYNKEVNKQLSLFCDEESERSIMREIGEGIKNVFISIKDFFMGEKKKYDFYGCLKKCNLSIQIDEK
jgi:preprotein translocase subunit SecA